MASRVGATSELSSRLAPVSLTPSCVPRAPVTRWRFVPGLSLSVGFGPGAGPLFGRDRGAVRARAAPVDLAGRVQALQQKLMQPRPHAGLLCQSRRRQQQLIPQPQPI